MACLLRLSLQQMEHIASNRFSELPERTTSGDMSTRASPSARIWSPESATAAAIGGLIALAAAIGVGRFVYTPILPPMIEALDLTRSAAGLIASANFLGYLVGALLAAMPNLPGSRRAWLLGALATSSITTGGMGLAATLAPFLILRFIGGAASAFVLILASAVVLERTAEAGRGRLSSLHFAGVGTGIAISAVLVAALMHTRHSWQALWLANGALALAATAAVAWLLTDRSGPARPAGRQGRQAIDPGLRRLTMVYGLFGFGYVITATFLVAIVRGTPAIRPLESAIWVVFGAAAVPSVALWARVATRFGLPAAFASACLTEAAGVLASVAWPTMPGAFLSAVLVGGTFMGLTALGLVWARTLAGGNPRRALALMTGAFGLGQIIGPAFAGVVSDRLGSFTVPSLAAVLALVAAAALARRRPVCASRIAAHGRQ
jgi:predicted MFS family arabinose efflux permease